jgi:hypothetical protein
MLSTNVGYTVDIQIHVGYRHANTSAELVYYIIHILRMFCKRLPAVSVPATFFVTFFPLKSTFRGTPGSVMQLEAPASLRELVASRPGGKLAFLPFGLFLSPALRQLDIYVYMHTPVCMLVLSEKPAAACVYIYHTTFFIFICTYAHLYVHTGICTCILAKKHNVCHQQPSFGGF